MYQECVDLLNKRGVTLEDIADCVVFLQKDYVQGLNRDMVLESVQRVLQKREVQQAVLTGIAIDLQVEKKEFCNEQIVRIIQEDYGLYGIDEVLAYGICNLYGSIALTNYGYIDKVKPGIIGRLNEPHDGVCNTFLDDLVGAIAAAAASRFAHNQEAVYA